MAKNFSGTSNTGDFHEALEGAIVAAKEGLGPTDFVKWKLVEIRGENGGFVHLNALTVVIAADSAASP